MRRFWCIFKIINKVHDTPSYHYLNFFFFLNHFLKCISPIKMNSLYESELILPDVTAVCILESFQNPQTLVMAERVLKDLGKNKAKQAYQVNMSSRVHGKSSNIKIDTTLVNPL